MLGRWLPSVRTVLLSLLTCLSALSQAQSTIALKLRSGSEAPGVWIVKGGKATAVPDTEAWNPVSWSSDGRWLALGRPTKGGFLNLAIVDTTSAMLIKLELVGECSPPTWSPDGKRFAVSVSGHGLRQCDVAGSDPVWTPLLPSGSMPNWSPNGGRIAFVGPTGGPGVWTTGDDGASTRSIDKRPGAVRLAWAPDGRTLAVLFTAKKGHDLSLVTPGGQARSAANVDSDQFAWSPNAASLVVRQRGQWGVLTTKTGTILETGLNGPPPQWVDSRTLVTVQDGTLCKYVVGSSAWEPLFTSKPGNLPDGRVESFALFQGLVLDGKFDDPWSKSPPPKVGQIRLIGTVDDVDLDQDRATIKVWSVLNADGMELNLAKPLLQVVRVTPASERAAVKGNTRLETTDFQSDAEVLLIVDGSKAGVLEALNVEFGVLPGISDNAGPSDVFLDHPNRSLEYDGVSMDSVVVPMVFPVVGPVSWSDTFLANRDGGNRRHHGQDLLAPKMRPLVAVFDGVITFNRSKAGHNTITLRGDAGWTVVYMHVNNDHPGTDDGQGGGRYAFAPGLHSGDRVVRGQLVGYCGDSGNAEGTAPHCHFELHDDVGGGVLNAFLSLSAAEHLSAPLSRVPPLDRKLEPGESRWDIVVVKHDKERGVVVGELVSQSKPGEPDSAASFPRQVFVRLKPDTKVALRADASEPRNTEDLRPGQFVTVVGPEPHGNQAMDARFLGFGLNFSQ